MLVILSLVWGDSFFFNSVVVAELPVLTIVLGHVGYASRELLFNEMGGSCDAGGLPNLAGFFLEVFLNNIIAFGLHVWALSVLRHCPVWIFLSKWTSIWARIWHW